MKTLTLSALPKTWLIDIDGTLVRHNGYLHDKDELLGGVREFFASLPKDDIVILLTARSIFWQKDFDIIFNSDDRLFSQKYKAYLLSISDTIALANDGRYFIGYRSGLCDVIAYFSNYQKIFIYPTNPHTGDSAEKYFELSTTKDLWKHNKAKEYVYSQELLKLISKLDVFV